MSTFPTLPTGPLPHLAMDYSRLRAEGLRLLERLAGEQWTDFNAHDPGVTILEQLCYAITDLGYRINYPMADLLAGSTERGLPGPAEILTGDPVTRNDLRAQVLDIGGIGNGWVEDPLEPELSCYQHQGSGELHLQADPSEVDARPIRLRGLHRVMLQTTDQLSGVAALEQVAARIHRSRMIGEDFEIVLLGSHEVWLRANIEIGPSDDPVALLADIIESIETYLASPARFITLAEARARGRTIDELFEGPPLIRGFVDELPAPRRTVYMSDLLHAITDVPQVRAVCSIEMASSPTATREPWALEIPTGHIATLAQGAELILLRAGLPVQVNISQARTILEQRRSARALAAKDPRELQPPAGRERSLARYRSIQRQLPAAYGIGSLGLPALAPAHRRAQARQLEAYLLIFDQLLANAFAQLAHAHELLSPDEGATRSYFAQPVDDPPLRLHELLKDPDAYSTAVEPGDPLERRKRFLAHLLARFAEQLGEHWLFGQSAGIDRDEAIVAVRQAFLREYPRLSGARGSGHDIHDDGSTSGLAERLRLKLGSRHDLHFHVVEHVLLRPLAEDSGQLGEEGEEQVPLLADVDEPDPWSFQVSFVFKELDDEDPDFEQLVGHTILTEAPAQLVPRLHWFGTDEHEDHWTAFEDAWAEFRAVYRAYRKAKLQTTKVADEIQLRARDARDRVIDLLGFGSTYPLRDLPLPSHLIVAPESPAVITLPFTQRDVMYELWSLDTNTPIEVAGQPLAAEGKGGELVLTTPPIHQDTNYRILAVKGTDNPRAAWLRGIVRVEEGIDPTLIAQLLLPPLDKGNDNPGPGDARIAYYGAHVEIELHDSQEGVRYELLDDADHANPLSPPVIGTSGTIVLTCGPVTEDIDLRVRGSREMGDPQNPTLRTAVLNIILPLRVRANPATSAELAPAIAAHGGSSTLQLASSQESVGYRVWQRPIRDREFVFEQPPAVATIDVAAEGNRIIHVQRPEKPVVWEDLPGFEPLGDARPGTGGTLELTLDQFERDTVLLVQAIKEHRNGPLGNTAQTIPSAMQLDRALALLVRPNHGQALRVLAMIDGEAAEGPLQVTDGQPGVYYELRLEGAVSPIDRPVYFHQRDDVDATFNKGIDQLRVEVDLALARDAEVSSGERSRTPPPWPLLDSELVPGTTLHVRARKAMSGIEVELDHTVTVERGGQ